MAMKALGDYDHTLGVGDGVLESRGLGVLGLGGLL